MTLDYAAARTEIEANLAAEFTAVKGVTSAEDTAQSDAAIAAIESHFNQEVDQWIDLPVSEFAAHVELTGLAEKALAANTDEARKIVRIAVANTSVETIRMSDPSKRQAVEAVLTKAVTDLVWTRPEADSVLNLAKRKTKRSDAFGGTVGRGTILLLKSGRV